MATLTKRKKRKRKATNQKVTISISRSDVAFVVRELRDNQVLVRGHHLTWRQQASSLTTEDGARELTAALTTLVNKEKVAGATARIALSSDYCVTRVLTGQEEKIHAELRAARERSMLYLALGAGDKAATESRMALDAKHRQAWLTVINQRVLDHVTQAAEQAGLEVELLEHDLMAICRALGSMQKDAQAPVIVIAINDRGVDLGVSYRGQLLFDYRPGGLHGKARVGEIVQRHLDRIQRYCNRQFRFAAGTISQVFVCGDNIEVAQVLAQFRHTNLHAEALEPRGLQASWECDSELATDNRYLAALGTALIPDEQLARPAVERGLPDLMDTYRATWREPLAPALARCLWPLAATLLAAAGGYGVALLEHRRAAGVEQSLADLEGDLKRVINIEEEVAQANLKFDHLKRINEARANPAYHELVLAIGQAMPQGVRLKTVQVTSTGDVAITGPSATEDAVFEFVNRLQKTPVLKNVSLEGQRSSRRGEGIEYDIKCRYDGGAARPERTARND